ncbi:KilA-N domain-containing protein, partial [Morganella morganii]
QHIYRLCTRVADLQLGNKLLCLCISQPVNVLRGGTEQGTYVCKELVYAYAMWISPSFNLKVIRTFDVVAGTQQ